MTALVLCYLSDLPSVGGRPVKASRLTLPASRLALKESAVAIPKQRNRKSINHLTTLQNRGTGLASRRA